MFIFIIDLSFYLHDSTYAHSTPANHQPPNHHHHSAHLHLGEVEVGPAPALEERARVVEEEEAKVEEAAGDGRAVDEDVLLPEVPPARADDHHRAAALLQAVRLAVGGKGERAADGGREVGLPADEVVPGRAVGVLEVCVGCGAGWVGG